MLGSQNSFPELSNEDHMSKVENEAPCNSKKKNPGVQLGENESTCLDSIVLPKNQILNLIYRYLMSHGYRNVAGVLAEEINISADRAITKKFQSLILNGEYIDALLMIDNYFAAEDNAIREDIKKTILAHWFYEILVSGNQIEALRLLRVHFASHINNKHLFEFILPLMFPQGNYIPLSFFSVNNFPSTSRTQLIDKIHAIAPNTATIDDDRLENLLKYSILFQVEKCPIHSFTDLDSINISLLKDHACNLDKLPSYVSDVISHYKTRIWNVEFSHNGSYFAVLSREKYLSIFDQNEHDKLYCQVKAFTFDTLPTNFEWSPDDSMILVSTAVSRFSIYVCKLKCPSPLDVLTHQIGVNETITCIDWFPDSKRYLVGTIEGNVYVINLDGHVLSTVHGFRANAVKVISDGNFVLISDHLKRVILWNIKNSETRCIWQEEDPVVAFTLCPDKQNVIFSIKGKGFLLYSFRYSTVMRYYYGIKQQLMTCKPSFMGGANSKMFVSASENGCIYYFHLNKNDPIQSLQYPNKSTVNSVAWCQINPSLLVSGSEDGTIAIWRARSDVRI